jgi:hypothetical protein
LAGEFGLSILVNNTLSVGSIVKSDVEQTVIDNFDLAVAQ